MKVLSVNNSNNINFNGLWGKTNKFEITKPEYQGSLKEYTYYPFWNEKENQIKEIQQENTIAREYCTKTKNNSKIIKRSEYAHVTVKERLPFTSTEFENYLKKTLSIVKQRLIERHVFDKGLRAVK